MENEIKGCKFCGQLLIDESMCDCPEVTKKREKAEGMTKLETRIQELTKNEEEKEIEIIKLLAIAVYDYRIQSASLKTTKGIVFKFGEDSKGNLRVKRNDSQTQEVVI